MRKSNLFTVFAGVLLGVLSRADAAYPAYPSYQMPASGQYPTQMRAVQNTAMYPVSGYGVPGVAMYNQYPQYNTGTMVQNAASPSRVTGQLPKVGSSATNAGRQYYQSEDYDRLADSGLYIGLSAAYAASISGSIYADYQNETNAFFVPGAFEQADFDSDAVIPLQISVGAAINNDVRADFSYLRYSGMSYPGMVKSSDGVGGFIDAEVDGGAITSNATMLNVYYNIDSYTGYLAGGMLRPYIGAGVGISLNTIADYVVYDETFYDATGSGGLGSTAAGDLTGISDVFAYHNGGTTEQLAFTLEGGLSTELDGGMKLDFFIRYANLGTVKTSGSIVVSQTEWLGDGAGGEYQAPYDSVYHYTNWYESGRLSTVDVGARLRLQF